MSNLVILVVALVPLGVLLRILLGYVERAQFREWAELEDLAAKLGLKAEGGKRLTGKAPPLLSVRGLTLQESEENQLAALEVVLQIPAPTSMSYRSIPDTRAAWVRRISVAGNPVAATWSEWSGTYPRPPMEQSTRLGDGFDEDWQAVTQGGGAPGVLAGTGRRLLLDPSLRSLEILPAGDEAPRSGQLIVVARFHQRFEAGTILEALSSCDRALNLGLAPLPRLDPAPNTWQPVLTTALVLGSILGLVASLLAPQVPAIRDLITDQLCAPGDSLQWVETEDSGGFECSSSSWRLLFLPVWAVLTDLAAAMILTVGGIQRTLKRLSRGR